MEKEAVTIQDMWERRNLPELCVSIIMDLSEESYGAI